MAAPDGLLSFPDDLFSLVLDDLALLDALQLLQVNRRWRLAVLAHPVYWKRLTVSCESDKTPAGMLMLFHRRLACADRRPVHINIAVKDPFGILAAVAESLAFTRELAITAPAVHGQAVMAALRNPAPELVNLRLTFTPSLERPPYPVIDAGVFAGHAPLLTAAQLTNVAIPTDVPLCLRGLKEINYGGSQWWYNGPLRLPYLFDRCPRLTMLLVSNGVYLAEDDYSNARFPRHLNYLAFVQPARHLNWLPWLATLTTVPKITIRDGDSESVAIMADHVAGVGGNVCLMFHLAPDSDCFVALFKSEMVSAWPTEVERSVQAPLKDGSLLRSDAFAGIVDLEDRITFLIIQSAAWHHLMSAMSSLPALKTLTLTEVAFDPAIVLQPGAAVECPRLEQLIIQTAPCREGPQTVSADVIAEFIHRKLLDAPLPLRLLAGGFSVDGTSPAFRVAGPPRSH